MCLPLVLGGCILICSGTDTPTPLCGQTDSYENITFANQTGSKIKFKLNRTKKDAFQYNAFCLLQLPFFLPRTPLLSCMPTLPWMSTCHIHFHVHPTVTHAPCHAPHAHPSATHTPVMHAPLWTEFLTHNCENITLLQIHCGRLI